MLLPTNKLEGSQISYLSGNILWRFCPEPKARVSLTRVKITISNELSTSLILHGREMSFNGTVSDGITQVTQAKKLF